jgi:DNA-directed RNA polymerase specialized sigma24 family protein
MFCARQSSDRGPTAAYATGADFHQIFQKDINRLYGLSLLLTADHSLAERCLVSGLEESSGSNRVFKAWLQSWTARTIIQNAIRMIRPTSGAPQTLNSEAATGQPAELAAVIELPPFERFAFILSVLERYSDQECSLLLNSNRGEVIAARTRALQSLGNSAELRDQQAQNASRGHHAVSASK